MQQYLEPSHKLPDEDSIRESLIKLVNNPDIQFILSSVHFTKKYKPSYWIQKENDRIIFAVKFKTKDAEISYVRLVKIERNDSAQTKIYTPFKELMRIVNSSGSYDFTHIYQDGSLITRVNPDGSKFYYHPDHLGSTSLITDANGNVVEQTFYSPFGELLGGGTAENKLYTGQFKDLTGQYYYGARYYKPGTGQFIKPDLLIQFIYNPQSMNRYSYSWNNPYKYKDDSGRSVTAVNEPVEVESEFMGTTIKYTTEKTAIYVDNTKVGFIENKITYYARSGSTFVPVGYDYTVRLTGQAITPASLTTSTIPYFKQSERTSLSSIIAQDYENEKSRQKVPLQILQAVDAGTLIFPFAKSAGISIKLSGTAINLIEVGENLSKAKDIISTSKSLIEGDLLGAALEFFGVKSLIDIASGKEPEPIINGLKVGEEIENCKC